MPISCQYVNRDFISINTADVGWNFLQRSAQNYQIFLSKGYNAWASR